MTIALAQMQTLRSIMGKLISNLDQHRVAMNQNHFCAIRLKLGAKVLFAILLLVTSIGRAQEPFTPVRIPTPAAPPPAPPIEFRELPATNTSSPHRLGLTPYSIGQPTDEEQLYLEY